MSNIVNWFTKEKVFFFSLIGLIVHVISKFSVDLGICSGYPSKCTDLTYLLVIFSFIFIAIFVFSLLTFKLKDTTFISWRNFSLWAIPLSLIIITFLPTQTHGLDFVPIVKGTVIIFLTILYSIISLLLVFYQFLKSRKSTTLPN